MVVCSLRDGSIAGTQIDQHRGMKTSKFIFPTLLILSILSTSATAENRMYLVRTASDRVEIRLHLEEPIAGFQFSIDVSEGSAIRNFTFDAQFTGSNWVSGSRIHGDTLVKALVMSWSRQVSVTPGRWTLGTISIDVSPAGDPAVAFIFDDALIADQNAQRVDMQTEDLRFNANDYFPADGFKGSAFALSAPYPNPFNPSTELRYVLQEPGDVRITVVDIIGREIRVLEEGYRTSGEGMVRWNGDDTAGRPVASGMYIIAMVHAGSVQVQRVFLQK